MPIGNILRKNQNGFRRNRSMTSQMLTICRILEGVRAKNLEATILFVDFKIAFDSIHGGKMEQILLAYGLPKEAVAAIMILYRNTKVKVCSPDGDTDYFDIVAGALQGDTLALYLFIICLVYVLRTSIDIIRENSFELTKKRSRRYPTKTITDADYAEDIAILANAPAQEETLLHSLERAAVGIGFHVNAHNTEYMCFDKTGVTLCRCSAKQPIPLSVLERNQTKGFGLKISTWPEVGRERLSESWKKGLEKGVGEVRRTEAVDTGQQRDQSAWDRVQPQWGKMSRHSRSVVEFSLVTHVSVSLHMHNVT